MRISKLPNVCKFHKESAEILTKFVRSFTKIDIFEDEYAGTSAVDFAVYEDDLELFLNLVLEKKAFVIYSVGEEQMNLMNHKKIITEEDIDEALLVVKDNCLSASPDKPLPNLYI